MVDSDMALVTGDEDNRLLKVMDAEPDIMRRDSLVVLELSGPIWWLLPGGGEAKLQALSGFLLQAWCGCGSEGCREKQSKS